MSFLPSYSDEELSADAALAASRQVAAQGQPLTSFQRVLIGHVPSFEAYCQLDALREAVSPFLGERVVTLFAFAFSQSAGSEYWSSRFRATLLASGEDLENPQVTEIEQLVIDWARLIAQDPRAIPADVYGRLEAALTPRHRLALLAFAGQLSAAILVADVVRLPAE